jgi:hypothetical protein
MSFFYFQEKKYKKAMCYNILSWYNNNLHKWWLFSISLIREDFIYNKKEINTTLDEIDKFLQLYKMYVFNKSDYNIHKNTSKKTLIDTINTQYINTHNYIKYNWSYD